MSTTRRLDRNVGSNTDIDGDDDDEWIFTLRAPNTSTTVQLRQTQPKVSSSSSQQKPPPAGSKSKYQPQQQPQHSNYDNDKVSVEEEYDKDDNGINQERMNLLRGHRCVNTTTKRLPSRRIAPTAPATSTASTTYMVADAAAAAAAVEDNHNNHSWTYTSPFWSMSCNSAQLLSITYCPAWQAIPEYTTQLCHSCCSKGCTTSRSSHSTGSTTTKKKNEISSISRLCCWNTCGTCTSPPVEYIQEIFTTSDIAKIVTSDHTNNNSTTNDEGTTTTIPMKHIRGIGICHTTKVYLRPMSTNSWNGHQQQPDPPNQHLQNAWEKHVQRMRGCNQPTDRTTTATTTNTVTGSHDTDMNHTEHDDDESYIGPIITFCVPVSQVDPPLLWKVFVPPIHEYPISIQTITVFDGQLHTAATTGSNHSGKSVQQQQQQQLPTHIYINGYQSWSFSGSLLKGTKQPGSALPNAYSKAFNLGGSPPPIAATTLQTESNHKATQPYPTTTQKPFQSYYQSDFFTCITSDGQPSNRSVRFPYQQIDETGGPALLLGWLSQNEQFGIISVDAELLRCQMHCSVDGQMLVADNVTGPIVTDWAYAQLVHPHSYDEEPMAHFLHNVGRFSEVAPLLNGGLLTGWCSWYVYYQNISERLLADNVAKLAAMRHHVPTNVSVVDDGYMTAWGDWDSLKPKSFPNGLASVSNDISSRGMRPGLWLAPFGADKNSKVAEQHPDWVICNNGGIAANSSFCGKFFYGLDATNPNVLAHVYESIRRAVHDWKFNVLKIDFLYAACLVGNNKYDLSMSRAQAMRLALKTIRDAAGPDVFLIGCGCPIASGIGYVDAMRISADTGPTWKPPLPLPWWDNGTLPSLRSMIRNSISRAPFGHRWWHNDPDCLMLGSHTNLTDVEVASAASVVAMSCGMLLLSDDLPTLSDARISIVSKIFPLTGATATVLDLHSTNDGLPSLMRLWCTDKYDLFDSISDEMDIEGRDVFDHNAKATLFARKASFHFKDDEPSHPSERLRSCIHVTKGLGTWTLISLSNWSDQSAVVRIPPLALSPPPTTGWDNCANAEVLLTAEECCNVATSGYHVFSFWSSKYTWLANHKVDLNDDPDHTVCKTLRPHQTELFHIKQVTPDKPQYIGSDLHFSCGAEVRTFKVMTNCVFIRLNPNYRREGSIFVFLPRVDVANVVQVSLSNVRALWNVVGNTPQRNLHTNSPRLIGRVIQIFVTIYSDGRPHDGEVKIDF